MHYIFFLVTHIHCYRKFFFETMALYANALTRKRTRIARNKNNIDFVPRSH